jgi:hypothetical protein
MTEQEYDNLEAAQTAMLYSSVQALKERTGDEVVVAAQQAGGRLGAQHRKRPRSSTGAGDTEVENDLWGDAADGAHGGDRDGHDGPLPELDEELVFVGDVEVMLLKLRRIAVAVAVAVAVAIVEDADAVSLQCVRLRCCRT